MNLLINLSLKSAWNRRYTLLLTIFSIALSCMLLLGIERLKSDARSSFETAVSGTDLIVGPRSSPLQLLLYSVFHIGSASNNLSWSTYDLLAKHPKVAWAVPITLGDGHREYPLVATERSYFTHFRYGQKQTLRFAKGLPFSDLFDVVIGHEVAQKLEYKLGDKITISHGIGDQGLTEHDDKPFIIRGILAPTGTPVDRSLYISLSAFEALHLDWQAGAPIPNLRIAPELVKKFDLQPKSITAVFVGLRSRAAVFSLQRELSEYPEEALSAILPGVALSQLWQMLNVVEKLLMLIAAFVGVASLMGLISVVLATLNERRRELAILRSVGARPWQILALLAMEGMMVTLIGTGIGFILTMGLISILSPWVVERYNFVLQPMNWVMNINAPEYKMMMWIVMVGFLASLIPAIRAYFLSLSDGLTPKI